MQKFFLYCITGSLVLMIAGWYGCKKVNGINNNQVVATPFSLYFSDTSGSLYNTTDGSTFQRLNVKPDGTPCRAICTIGPNILWAKGRAPIGALPQSTSLLISIDNGLNFNHTYDSLQSMPDVDCKGLNIDLNQTMLFSSAAWNRVYAVSGAPGDASNTNYLGLVHNDTFGVRGHWTLEVYYDTDRVGMVGAAPYVHMKSLTQLANGVLCGLAIDDVQVYRNFYKTCADNTCRWKECTANPLGLSELPGFNPTGNPLPPNATALDPGYFSLGHINNRLIAIDANCLDGAWYSDDTGANWAQCQGLPNNVPLLCIASPFEQVCLIGTDGSGLYIFNQHTQKFELNNNGLGKDLKVRSIAFKENIFKNTTSEQFVFIATDQGIYQSKDGGYNWTLTIPGNYVALY